MHIIYTVYAHHWIIISIRFSFYDKIVQTNNKQTKNGMKSSIDISNAIFNLDEEKKSNNKCIECAATLMPFFCFVVVDFIVNLPLKNVFFIIFSIKWTHAFEMSNTTLINFEMIITACWCFYGCLKWLHCVECGKFLTAYMRFKFLTIFFWFGLVWTHHCQMI